MRKMHPAWTWPPADRRIAHERQFAHDRAAAQFQHFDQPWQRHAPAGGHRHQRLKDPASQGWRDEIRHAGATNPFGSKDAWWLGMRWGINSTGMALDVGVPAAIATADSGTSGLVSG